MLILFSDLGCKSITYYTFTLNITGIVLVSCSNWQQWHVSDVVLHVMICKVASITLYLLPMHRHQHGLVPAHFDSCFQTLLWLPRLKLFLLSERSKEKIQSSEGHIWKLSCKFKFTVLKDYKSKYQYVLSVNQIFLSMIIQEDN